LSGLFFWLQFSKNHPALFSEVHAMTIDKGSRLGIIEAVKVPLGFFTLGILIMEGILGALAYKAQGFDFTLLVIGALGGFFTIIVMVFVLAAFPSFRDALLAREKDKFTGKLLELQLTENDILFLHAFAYDKGHAERTPFGTKPIAQRIRDLADKGLMWDKQYGGPLNFELTANGREVVTAIRLLAGPFLTKH
jgi:hypothetical protein